MRYTQVCSSKVAATLDINGQDWIHYVLSAPYSVSHSTYFERMPQNVHITDNLLCISIVTVTPGELTPLTP